MKTNEEVKYVKDQGKLELLKAVLKDIKNGTSFSVDYLYDVDIEKSMSAKGIKIRKIFSPLMRLVYKTQSDYKLSVVKREKLKDDDSKIYIINHQQPDDIVLGANLVNDDAYILFGNKYLILDTQNGLGLWAYGVIPVDREDKVNRNVSVEKSEYVLDNGGNVIYYPEGYWYLSDDGEAVYRTDDKVLSAEEMNEKYDIENNSPEEVYEIYKQEQAEKGKAKKVMEADGRSTESWIIQEPNIGAFRMAQRKGVGIVPCTMVYDDLTKQCYGYLGEEMKIAKDDDVFAKKDELVEQMRTATYKMMEDNCSYDRATLERAAILREKGIKVNKKTVRKLQDGSYKFKGSPEEMELWNNPRETGLLKKQWLEDNEKKVAYCDIPRINYKLDLEDEKLIGRAPVLNPVTTKREAFAVINDLNKEKTLVKKMQ